METPLTYFKVDKASVIVRYAWSAWSDKYTRRGRDTRSAERMRSIALCVTWNRALKWHFKCNDAARRLNGVPVHESDINALVLISQPEGSYCCGQCCVAMIAGRSLEVVKKAMGKNGSTTTRVIQKGLKKLGVRHKAGRLRAIRGDLSKLPHTGILKVAAPWRRSGWHWVLKHNRKIYDPARGVYQVAEYTAETSNIITSYLEIFTDKGGASYIQQIGRAVRPGVNYVCVKHDGPAINAPKGARRFSVPPDTAEGTTPGRFTNRNRYRK